MAPNPFYATTGTRKRHIINPDDRAVMLCSDKLPARIPEFKVIDGEMTHFSVRNLPECKNCERKAAKLGVVEDQASAEAAVVPVVGPPSEDEFVNVAADGGKVHSAWATDSHMIPLCRDGRGPKQFTFWSRVDAPLTCSHCVTYYEGRATARAKNTTTTESETTDNMTSTPPTPLMLEALAEAAKSWTRRVPSKYTTGTTAGLVTRGLVTPGTDHYLTTHGLEVLRELRPDAPVGIPMKIMLERVERGNSTLAGLGFPKLALWARETVRHYPNRPAHLATGLLEVPGVILFGWSCEDCASEPEQYESAGEAQGAALRHAKEDETCKNAGDAVVAEAATVLAEHEVTSKLEDAEAPETAAPEITYTTGEGWTIAGEGPIGDFADARDLLTDEYGRDFKSACAALDRAHLEVLNTDLPPNMQVREDGRFGGFEYVCMGGQCKRSGAHDSPGGAAMYAWMHREHPECVYPGAAEPVAEGAVCGEPMHRKCACVRSPGHNGPCNCAFRDGAPGDAPEPAEGHVIAHQGTDRDPDTAMHYQPRHTDQGAVCGAAAVADPDPGMTSDHTAVTCLACIKAMAKTSAGLPRRLARPDGDSAIENAARRLRAAGAATDAEQRRVDDLMSTFDFPDTDQTRAAMLRLIRSGDLLGTLEDAPEVPEAVFFVDDVQYGTGHYLIRGGAPLEYEDAKTALMDAHREDEAERVLRRATCEALSLVAGPGISVYSYTRPGTEAEPAFGFLCSVDGVACVIPYSTAQNAYQSARAHRRPGGECPEARTD